MRELIAAIPGAPDWVGDRKKAEDNMKRSIRRCALRVMLIGGVLIAAKPVLASTQSRTGAAALWEIARQLQLVLPDLTSLRQEIRQLPAEWHANTIQAIEDELRQVQLERHSLAEREQKQLAGELAETPRGGDASQPMSDLRTGFRIA